MKRTLLIFAALSVVVWVGGCAMVRAPVVPPVGWIYTRYQAPLMTDVHDTDLGSKEGTSVSRRITFYVSVAWGDAALRSAAQAANITTLKYADYELFNVLGIYQEFTVHAYGD